MKGFWLDNTKNVTKYLNAVIFQDVDVKYHLIHKTESRNETSADLNMLLKYDASY